MQNGVHEVESMLVATLVQLIVILLTARIAGAAATAVGQPRSVGEILAGLALGPSLLGTLFPSVSGAIFSPASSAPVQVLSQIGLILLMFQIGSDFEFGQLRAPRNRRIALLVTAASVTIPLAAGFVLGQVSAPVLAPGVDPLVYSLFLAVALAVTAVPILGRILREYSLTRQDVGVIAITAAAANDVIGWLLLAGVTSYASARFSSVQFGWRLAGLVALGLFLYFPGQRFVDWLATRFAPRDRTLPGPLMAIVLACIFAAGIATEKLGIFTIFGGFLFGLLFHRHHAFVDAWRVQVGQFVLVFFLPIFFTYTGLRTNVLGLDTPSDWAWCAAVFAVSVLTKMAPVYTAARLGGLPGWRAAILGALMNTRALMELIVLNIGLSMGFIPQDVFTMLVIMAVGTTVMTGPLLHVLLPRAGILAAERVDA